VCGGARTRRLYSKSGHAIARCAKCGLVFATPRAPSDAILGRYGHDYFWNEYLPALGVFDGQFDLAAFDSRYAPLLALLGPASGRRLFEVGCGAGFFLKAAERAGWSVSGIELSEEACRFGRDRLGLDILQEFAEYLSAAPSNTDAVVMFDTIEHLFDPRAALTSIAGTLVAGGQILIGTPNFQALSRRLLGASWAVLSPLEHMFYFEDRTLRTLLERCGFADVRFIHRHEAWSPQETMNFMCTHSPHGLRTRLAALIGRIGGKPLARAIQRAGRQDILLCLATRR
jgi:2-polyprenyl-3-methyl-5-hydroxy-6-metoxy-1,4-benzoquinol methylase